MNISDGITSIVVAVVIVCIGVFAVSSIWKYQPADKWSPTGHQSALDNTSHYMVANMSTSVGNSFSIIGVGLIIGAVCIIAGIVISTFASKKQ